MRLIERLDKCGIGKCQSGERYGMKVWNIDGQTKEARNRWDMVKYTAVGEVAGRHWPTTL